jgi:DNA-binding response OmpR family regulator
MSDTPKILLVDDEPGSLKALEVILQDEDCTLLKAASGDEALDYLLKHDVALVVLDLQRPGMSGFEVAELMRRRDRTRRVPILFLTDAGKHTRYLPVEHDVGAMDYLVRPLAPEIILGKARFFLDLDRQKRRLDARRRRSQESHAALLKMMGMDDPSSGN